LAHTRFCLKYPGDCRTNKILFRGGLIALNAERRAELARINTEVNRSIKPERTNETVAEEKWLISPKAGDCNDYAVTKRHELLARGWPARALLLAEVITTWGEHHLVLVVRSREGDVVADSLNTHISNWTNTHYQWVRIQSPTNPMFWSTLTTPEPELAAIEKADREL
jgi:predicted transglutaminase-like cysteine proteinase